MTTESPEIIDGVPALSGRESVIAETIAEARSRKLYPLPTQLDLGRIRAAASVALHMHQPLIPAGGDHLQTARIIGNLEHMWTHPEVGDNHNAPAFCHCYKRMGEEIPALLREGKSPRVMLEYSGTLLYGLRQMGQGDVLETLRTLTTDSACCQAVEWLGGPWGHAVAPSTPPQDYKLHIVGWQHHFAALFGLEALARVRGFSPSEMALPNHPDGAYLFVKTLCDCGYQWVLVQEHTVEAPETGLSPNDKHVPHRLVCRSSTGEEASILAIIKTQGSDTKLVGQMQPYYEAKSLRRSTLGAKTVPPLATQIADGENGGVMMNEFMPKYRDVVREAHGSEVVLMNVTEYLEHLEACGIATSDFPVLQPVHQKRIWDRFTPGDGPQRLADVIEDERRKDQRFHVDGGSWTGDISWVRGYDNVLGPMEEASAQFGKRMLMTNVDRKSAKYREALFLLLCAETSCFRYWGQGAWTDYGRELCRRAIECARATG